MQKPDGMEDVAEFARQHMKGKNKIVAAVEAVSTPREPPSVAPRSMSTPAPDGRQKQLVASAHARIAAQAHLETQSQRAYLQNKWLRTADKTGLSGAQILVPSTPAFEAERAAALRDTRPGALARSLFGQEENLFSDGRTQAWRHLLTGLSGAGKTTVLFKLKLGETLVTEPTAGFNIESVEFGGRRLPVWELGGGAALHQDGSRVHEPINLGETFDRSLCMWRSHYESGLRGARSGPVRGVIFVVDAADRALMAEARRCLRSAFDQRRFSQDSEARLVLLVLANKSDLPGALGAAEVEAQLELPALASRVLACSVHACSAVTGEGLVAALGWYVSAASL